MQDRKDGYKASRMYHIRRKQLPTVNHPKSKNSGIPSYIYFI